MPQINFSTKTYIIIFVVISAMLILYMTCSNNKDKIVKNNITNNNNISDNYIKEKSIDSYDIPGFNNIETNVFMDITKNNIKFGTIEIELFDDDVPITAKNFRYLCSGQNDKITYKNSIFHRIIRGHLIQGGDITNFDGTGGISAYGGDFKHENYNLKHNQEGLLTMVNNGCGKSNSQFFISTRRGGCKEFDNKYVVFGIVVKGYDIIKKIEKEDVNDEYKPSSIYKISRCGLIGSVKYEDTLMDDLNMNDASDIKISI